MTTYAFYHFSCLEELFASCVLLTMFVLYLEKKNDGSATSVDVEEHLYGLAKDMGITVVTSSQVRLSN